MYKRENRQHFDKRLREMDAEKRLTDNQREWEEEAYKLNNRLAYAEKRGYRFEDDIIPERPSRVTRADIEHLKNINRHRLEDYATSYEYEDDYTDEIEEDISEPEPYEPTYPESSDYDTSDDMYDDEDEDEDNYEPEPYNPQEDYYNNDHDRDYDNDFPPTEGHTVIENIRDMLGRQSYIIESDKWSTTENLRIKYDAATKISLALRVAIEELGEDNVARGIQTVGAKVVNDAADIALFLMYRDEAYTENMTIKNLDIVIDAFFAADPSKKMSYDYYTDDDSYL